MNKDVDERLVPNGEYRDAMNIQVSTSDGSAVGTVQNVLGNSLIYSPPSSISGMEKCIGKVADEKNDAFYWFTTSTGRIDILEFNSASPQPTFATDKILQHKDGDVTTVFRAKSTLAYTIYQIGGNISWNINAQTITFPPSSPIEDLSVGMNIQASFNMSSYKGMVITAIDFSNKVISVDGNISWMSGINSQQHYHQTKLFFKHSLETDGSVLGFKPQVNITGINVIDDLLFWTDGLGEPKKINISQSILGTSQSQQTPTLLINDEQDITLSDKVVVKKEHITVIRRGPTDAIKLQMHTSRGEGMYSGVTNTAIDPIFNSNINQSSIISSSNPNITLDYSAVEVGDTIKLEIESDINGSGSFTLQWGIGDTLLFKEFNEDGTTPQVPLANYNIRGVIIPWSQTSFTSDESQHDQLSPYGNMYPGSMQGTAHVAVKILNVKSTPSQPSLNPPFSSSTIKYAVDLEPPEESIFPLKFPRFSCRYKYRDGEYSTFAPWTDVAFSPGNFHYEPKEGWNTGMVNQLQAVTLKNLIPPNLPMDVVSVDILYKEDVSPNIYLVDTISKQDQPKEGASTNNWDLDEYKIDSETVKATIPSNQSLRPWDNVPKKALAQEITGNRIVYGNYTQNYNINEEGSEKYRPIFNNRLDTWGESISGAPLRSIKSLRDYKLGVVFTDAFGRETPIITSESGGFKVGKNQASGANKLIVGMGELPPSGEFKFFKFYIKETSTEYHNLPMDRWYSAEDGNIWLAFPSSDRNKVDIDTTLLLKKSDSATEQNYGKYKVLAIENEAPVFIKTRRLRIGTVLHDNNVDAQPSIPAQLFGSELIELKDAPIVGDNTFSVSIEAGNFLATSMADIDSIENTLHVRFTRDGDLSGYYRVAHITKGTHHYRIALSNKLTNDIDFIYDIPSSASKVLNGTRLQIYKDEIDDSPKFEGRFFVKIANDGKIKVSVIDGFAGITYSPTGTSRKVFMLKSDVDLAYIGAGGLLVSAPTDGITGTPQALGQSWIKSDGHSYADVNNDDRWTGDREPATHSVGPNNNNYYGGGQNYASHYARAAYFTAFDNPFTGTMPDGREELRKGNVTTGVWFIDRSTQKYIYPTPGDKLRIPQNNNMNWASPKIMHWDDCDNPGVVSGGACNDTHTNVSNGITHHGNSAATQRSRMRLSFGGIRGLGGVWGGGYEDGIGSLGRTNSTFWGIGTTNGYHDNIETQDFVEKLNPGFSFKWKEDPTETIYTISGNTQNTSRIRFERHADGFYNNKPWLIQAPSSYHKNWQFDVTPKMNLWDPSGSPGTMIASKRIGSTAHSISATTDGSSIIQVSTADTETITPGMTVYGPGMPNATVVMSVNSLTGEVVISNTATNSTTADRDFGFTIRAIDSSAGTNAVHPWIRVDSIRGECSYHGKVYELEQGMKLHSWNLDSNPMEASSNGSYDLIISGSPEPEAGGTFMIKLTGYDRPYMPDVMGCGGFGGDLCNDPSDPTNAAIAGEKMLFKQVTMNGVSPQLQKNIERYEQFWETPSASLPSAHGPVGALGYTMVFMEPVEIYEDGGVIPKDPYVWETEPKESEGLDIYYEISDNLPITLNASNITTVMPVGSVVTSENGEGWYLSTGTTILYTDNIDTIHVDIPACVAQYGANPLGCTDIHNGTFTPKISVGSKIKIKRPTGFEFEVEIAGIIPGIPLAHLSNDFVVTNLYNADYWLGWHNCWSFGNGVESNRIRDNFNLPYISNGVKASTTLEQEYKEEHRKYGLIYSGIYNSTSGINNLNQFIAAEKITKDINPIYGSIQKLYSRSTADGDLITLCEDRILKILANKDAVYNADGNPQLTATQSVLGQTLPFSGEYGISKNPESFASESYRVYFTDKVRGAVIRLSKDGLTAISDHGMKEWFRDNLKLNNTLIGSHDDKKNEYNITLRETGDTLSFREDVKGWVSFKSFNSENALSCANEYYTFEAAKLYKHHSLSENRNTFNGVYKQSHIEVILNDMPGSVKSFKTLNYEGSQARILENLDPITNGTFNDGEYYNLIPKKGWFADTAYTDLENGSISEFIEKEGKWFGYFTGKEASINTGGFVVADFNTSDFSVQGLGVMNSVSYSIIYGCMEEDMYNYNPSATMPGSVTCIEIVYGCLDQDAMNTAVNIGLDPGFANTDDGSCLYGGCTDSAMWNYDQTANYDDGSCIAFVYGCTDVTMFNQNGLANTPCLSTSPDGYDSAGWCGTYNCCCVSFIHGCTDPNATNFITLVDASVDVNTDDGSCLYEGCTDPLATNYDFTGSSVDSSSASYLYLNGTAVDDGSCTFLNGCMDHTACNYDANAAADDGSCTYCGDNTDASITNFGGTVDLTCTAGCIHCQPPTGFQITSQTTSDAGMSNGTIELQWTASTSPTIDSYNITWSGGYVSGIPASSTTYTITGLDTGTMSIQIFGLCNTSSGGTAIALGPSINGTTTLALAPGCTDVTACNYMVLATVDDGSCDDGTPCTGCTNASYSEYCGDCWDPVAQVAVASGGSPYVSDDGSCVTIIVSGCTDSTATNYNPLATIDDGSCIAVVNGCMDTTLNNGGTYAASNYSGPPIGLANTDDGSCLPYNCPTISIVQGVATTPTSSYSTTNFRINTHNTPYPNTSFYWNGSGTNATIDGNNVNLNPWSSLVSGNTVVGVKTDEPTANYFTAGSTTVDIVFNVITADGNCSITETQTFSIGCSDPTASNYDPAADINDQSQCTYIIPGCTDTTPNNDGIGFFATNYNSLATDTCTDVSGGLTGTSSDENACCTYPDPAITFQVHNFNYGTINAYNTVDVRYDSTGTAFTTAQFAPGLTWDSINQGSFSNNSLSSAGIDTITTIDPTTLTNHPLTITGNASFQAQIINPYLNNTLTTAVIVNQTYTYGCKYDNDPTTNYANWDSTLDLQEQGSCIVEVQGCSDPTAMNALINANTDCAGTFGGTDFSCCYYSCGVPGTLTATLSSGFYAAVLLIFEPTLSAYKYQVMVTNVTSGVVSDQSVEVGDTSLAIDATTGVGVWTFTNAPDGYNSGDTIRFKIRGVCKDFSEPAPYDVYGAYTNEVTVAIP